MKGVEPFKKAAEKVLNAESVERLRSYGREIGVDKPTTKKKEILIQEILGIFTEEIEPIEKSRQGAPVKNSYVDPRLVEKMEKLKRKYLRPDTLTPELLEKMQPLLYRGSETDVFRRQRAYQNLENMLVFEDPKAEDLRKQREFEERIYFGQLTHISENSWLMPVDRDVQTENVLVPQSLIEEYDLREGDRVSCHAANNSEVKVAVDVLTINHRLVSDLNRIRFEEGVPQIPSQTLFFHDKEGKYADVTEKYFDWLIPIKRGQRGCILSEPKAGKSSLVYRLARSVSTYDRDTAVFVLLLDQAPEVAMQFKKNLLDTEFMYTTYEDNCDDHVFAAEFMLKRAKRYAESGFHVLFFVDSFNALARAYNETDASSGGKTLASGIESKTLHYLKKYFASARCFEDSGSLTLLCTVSSDTGNPADDFIAGEISALANLQIVLSGELSRKRIYPSVDLQKTRVQSEDAFAPQENVSLLELVQEQYSGADGTTQLLNVLKNSEALESFSQSVKEKQSK